MSDAARVIGATRGRRLFLASGLLFAAASSAAAAGDSARGAYLAAAAGCDQCHTDEKNGGKAFAGGKVFSTPHGTVVTPNITPDRTTGIGRWSAEDFNRAMRWGVAPDDTHYQPLFPFQFYARLSDEDLVDLKAFLDGVAPVARPDTPADLSLFAPTVAAVSVAVTPPAEPWQPNPAANAEINRGAYLVASVGRCGACHTPTSVLGAPEPDRFLAGIPAGRDGKGAVPNVTPDPETGIGKWSVDDIVTLLKDGQTPDFDFVGGSMAEIVKNTARLSDADRRAIALYLRTLPAKVRITKH